MRHVWGAFEGEHDLAFHGEYYQLDYLPAAMNPGPLADGPPPLYLAALGPQMFEAAGAVADGALVHPIHTRKYLRSVAEPAIARGLAQSGRRREQFGRTRSAPSATTPTSATTRASPRSSCTRCSPRPAPGSPSAALVSGVC